MKLTEEVVSTKIVLKDVICNQCGESLKNNSDLSYEGIIEVGSYGGYNSIIGDGCFYEFSLCETCLKRMFNTFKHSPFQDQTEADE